MLYKTGYSYLWLEYLGFLCQSSLPVVNICKPQPPSTCTCHSPVIHGTEQLNNLQKCTGKNISLGVYLQKIEFTWTFGCVQMELLLVHRHMDVITTMAASECDLHHSWQWQVATISHKWISRTLGNTAGESSDNLWKYFRNWCTEIHEMTHNLPNFIFRGLLHL